jgi:hypothetical protein
MSRVALSLTVPYLYLSSLECWLAVVGDKDCWLESILMSMAALSLT